MAQQKKFIVKNGLVAAGITYPTSDGTSNQVITTDGSGTVSFSTPSTTNITEGDKLFYTVTRANSAIDTRVTKTFIDNLSVDHDQLTNFVANEHIDWTVDQGTTNIHSGNYTNTDKSFNTYEYIADSDQTSFSGYDADSNELSYSINNLEVYHNGVHLSTTDFTATNGTSVVLNQGAAISDELVITAFESFTVASVATNIPFFKADGTQDNIALVSSALPFFKADGTQDNIGVS